MYKLKLENESGNIVDINDEIHYVVIGCSGLNPPSASLFTAKSPNKKGVKYNGSTLNERNIVVTIKILGDIEYNRNALYAWIDTEQYVKVRYQNGTRNVYCEGHVQDCEIDYFTTNEVINLAIVCENPYWQDLTEISTEISSILSHFTFSFAIDSNGIPLSTVINRNATIYNAGAETGCKIRINCLGNITNLTIFDENDVSRKFKIKTTLETNSVVVIDTESSPKTVKSINQYGVETNLMKYVDSNPTWFTLQKGTNVFGFMADSGEDNAEITISYRNKYSGV